jgi:hypothetical protein
MAGGRMTIKVNGKRVIGWKQLYDSYESDHLWYVASIDAVWVRSACGSSYDLVANLTEPVREADIGRCSNCRKTVLAKDYCLALDLDHLQKNPVQPNSEVKDE